MISDFASFNISAEDLENAALENLSIPSTDRRLFRRFLEEKKAEIDALWNDFLKEEASNPTKGWTPVMFTKIQDAPLSNPAKNVLKAQGITMVGHLIHYSRKDLLRFHLMGKNKLKSITDYLATLGLELASD